MAPCQLRIALDTDYPWMFDLHRRVYGHHIEALWGWDEAWQRAHFLELCASKRTHVVTLAGDDVGVVSAYGWTSS